MEYALGYIVKFSATFFYLFRRVLSAPTSIFRFIRKPLSLMADLNAPNDSGSQSTELKIAVLQDLFQSLTKHIDHNSTVVQETLKAEFNSTRELLGSIKHHVEDTGARSGLQAGHHEILPSKIPSEESRTIGESLENTLLNQIDTLEASNKELTFKINQMVNPVEHRQALKSLESSLDWYKEAYAKQKTHAGRLQTHITQNATNANEVIDFEVKGKFEYIRARIQSIVKKYCVGRPSKPRKDAGDSDIDRIERDRSYKLSQLHYLTEDDEDEFCSYWARGKIYSILESRIFNQYVYGLDTDLDETLADFEKLILKHNPGSDIGDWRALTIQYGKSLNMTNQSLVKTIARDLEAIFYPWVSDKYRSTYHAKGSRSGSKPSRDSPPSALFQDLLDICQHAYQLAVMLRQSRDKYTFRSIPEKTEIEADEDNYYELVDINGPDGQKTKKVGSRVWLCLFGALVKEPLYGEQLVMAKAQVICKTHRATPERPGSPKRHDTR
ncbi:hypothetical protein PVAG01_04502 [Phlyctema vagabunda]|uniref:Uncharacterized protein n=1 Tax=Phlyctema vagabunda TaxID=108571 RepID=A0ABR4PPE5_9HELO